MDITTVIGATNIRQASLKKNCPTRSHVAACVPIFSFGMGRNIKNKLGLSCAKLSLASAKLHTSLSSDQLKLATNYVQLYLLS